METLSDLRLDGNSMLFLSGINNFIKGLKIKNMPKGMFFKRQKIRVFD